jgi:hypothetical protein
MALYLVKAKPKNELMESLRQELDSGKISRLKPFGEELHHRLDNARTDNIYAYWIEEDYCSPPLAMERASVLDRYFDKISVDPVDSEEKGWNEIKGQAKDLAVVQKYYQLYHKICQKSEERSIFRKAPRQRYTKSRTAYTGYPALYKSLG